MAEVHLTLRLRCATCGFTVYRGVRCDEARRPGAVAFVPQTCSQCGTQDAAPTVRPYVLSESDRRLLRSLRIAQENTP